MLAQAMDIWVEKDKEKLVAWTPRSTLGHSPDCPASVANNKTNKIHMTEVPKTANLKNFRIKILL